MPRNQQWAFLARRIPERAAGSEREGDGITNEFVFSLVLRAGEIWWHRIRCQILGMYK